jgi:hypothetical protein
MSDEIETLTARARQLEQENALLRSMQSPGGDEAPAQAENLLLRSELGLVRGTQSPPSPAAAPAGDSPGAAPGAAPADVPKSLAEFNALPAAQRQLAARRMTRQQRDELLGRRAAAGQECYL